MEKNLSKNFENQNIVPENILLKEKWDALKTTFTNIEITDE